MPLTSRRPLPSGASLAWLSAFFLAVFLVFFRPAQAWKAGSAWDDTCYLVWLYKILLQSPSECYSSTHTFGTATLWIPAGIAGLGVSWLTSSPTSLWVETFVGLTAYALWVAAAFLTFLIVREYQGSKTSTFSPTIPTQPEWVAVLLLLTVPLLYYVTRRTTMSHPTEFFFALLATWGVITRRRGVWFLAYILLVATRINHITFVAVPIAQAIGERGLQLSRRSLVYAGIIFIIALPISYITFVHGYDSVTIPGMLRDFTLLQLYERLWDSPSNLALTALFHVSVMVTAVFYWKELPALERGVFFWVATQLAICVLWPTLGGSFGLRYLIGSYAGVFVLFLRLAKQGPAAQFLWRTAQFNAAWLLLITWIYGSRLWPWRATALTSEMILGPLSPILSFLHPGTLFSLLFYSPVVSVAYSYFPDAPLFQSFSHLGEHRLHGLQLHFLLCVTVACVACLIISLKFALATQVRSRTKNHSVSQSKRTIAAAR